ncbi:hypothetical protein ALI22I_03900 [Saccharothrix sp. ALI-22-I]|uniref:hypothetical protein n=1 Tax=Saccharothrix sp. ALI-22-I TaxID=1933778 RepID=UPI0009C510C9|nr:hypothetical protein [Saccharothrix sp. ALI-22-I]ONI92412.1 hypothetical protein ALI22I_03900 [Saccharothrix sp. ALI-22-I]
MGLSWWQIVLALVAAFVVLPLLAPLLFNLLVVLPLEIGLSVLRRLFNAAEASHESEMTGTPSRWHTRGLHRPLRWWWRRCQYCFAEHEEERRRRRRQQREHRDPDT